MTTIHEHAANFLSAGGLNTKQDVADWLADGETFRGIAEEMISGWDVDVSIDDAAAAIEAAYEEWNDAE